MTEAVLRHTWRQASEILTERTNIGWARSALGLLELAPVFHIGDFWVIKRGEWVSSQDWDTKYPNVWAKVLLTRDTPARVIEVHEDGWVYLEDSGSMTRYKAWPTSLKEIA